MIKLKFDARRNVIEMFRDKNIITALSTDDFGSLIREVKRIMEEANPKIARKKQRREERQNLIRNLKILVAIKFIDFWRYVKSLFNLK
ncbi:MAG TPA: hypothetical protein DDY52_03345 [Candidatus Moranbacteria bacterium]|nr:hypothetical protein [Candidatus Moranbacteria bacterium]